MPPHDCTRMTTRFLLAPLFAILIAHGARSPKLELHLGLGILLMAAGAAWLLFAPGPGARTRTLASQPLALRLVGSTRRKSDRIPRSSGEKAPWYRAEFNTVCR